MDWKNVYSGSIWTIVQAKQPDGRVFERAVRAPGARVILLHKGKILLQRERRHELDGKMDMRLPGGKVFDTYEEFMQSTVKIVEASKQAAIRETREETGLLLDENKLQIVHVDKLGATCEWDLYYWLADTFTKDSSGRNSHDSEAEEIEGHLWASPNELKEIVLDPQQFSESRSVAVLLRMLESGRFLDKENM